MIGRWDLSAGTPGPPRHSIKDLAEVWQVWFDPYGQAQAVGKGSDGVLRLWAVGTERVRLLVDFQQEIRSICYDLGWPRWPTAWPLASDQRGVIVWDQNTRRVVCACQGHAGKVWNVCFSSDGRTLATAGDDGSVRVWDAHTGAELHTVSRHEHPVRGVCFSPDGRTLASSCEGTIHLWDTRSWQNLGTLAERAGRVNALCFSPDGRRLAAACEEGTVVWDVPGQRLERTLGAHTGQVFCVRFRPDGATLATGGEDDEGKDQTVRLWDTTTWETRRVLHGDSITWSVCFSPDGRRLVSGHRSGAVHVWDADSGQETLTIKEHTTEVWCVAFSPDGHGLASASKSLKMWEAGP